MEMDAGTLERLLTDRALGGLSPDAGTLLAVYLADHADARALGERIGAAVAVARTALADAESARMPPFPTEVLRARMATRRRWMVMGQITGLAACVLIGIGLRSMWISGPTPVVDNSGSVRIVQHTPAVGAVVRPVVAETQRPGFWSGRQWYERAEQNRSERSQRVIWDSPLGRPRLGDAT